jgi:hypothetical protein
LFIKKLLRVRPVIVPQRHGCQFAAQSSRSAAKRSAPQKQRARKKKAANGGLKV